MATLERPKPAISPSVTKTELTAALTDIDRQLELADENENPIERFFKRDQLLELKDQLEADIAMSVPPSKLS